MVCMEHASADRLPAYAVAGWRRWSQDSNLVISIASDAGALGHPQEDAMIDAFSDGQNAAWGAPMVGGAFTEQDFDILFYVSLETLSVFGFVEEPHT